MAPLRVAHVVGTAGATGVESHLVALLSAFDRAEVEAVLFVPGPGPLVDRLRARGVTVEVGAPTRKLAFAETSALARRLAGSFDVAHAHGPRAIFWTLRAARGARVPFVATVHELRWITLPPGLRRSAWVTMEAWALARADRLIAVSHDVRRQWAARDAAMAGRMTVVAGSTPMLLEPDRLPRARPGAAAGPVRLVTVGRLVPEKRTDRLLAAVAALGASGVACTLTVIGAGAAEPELRSLAARMGIESRVHWQRHVDDIAGALAGADAFVTATRTESFGIAVLEAMAVGLPVVAPSVGALPELVTDGETGTLIAGEDDAALPARLAQAIEALARDPARAARMGAAAAGRARTAFAPGRMAAEVAGVYREVLAGRGRPSA